MAPSVSQESRVGGGASPTAELLREKRRLHHFTAESRRTGSGQLRSFASFNLVADDVGEGHLRDFARRIGLLGGQSRNVLRKPCAVRSDRSIGLSSVRRAMLLRGVLARVPEKTASPTFLA